jgi:hypothetical protein
MVSATGAATGADVATVADVAAGINVALGTAGVAGTGVVVIGEAAGAAVTPVLWRATAKAIEPQAITARPATSVTRAVTA